MRRARRPAEYEENRLAMPHNVRALIVVLCLAAVILPVARIGFAQLMSREDYWRRCAVWCLIVIVAFLAPSVWVFMAIAGCILAYAWRKDDNPIALYFFVLFAAPVFTARIPGFGPVNYVFDIDYLRLLSLAILVPTFLSLISKRNMYPFGRTVPDLFVLSFIMVTIVLQLRGTTVTDTARYAFYAGIDVLLPYYVVSRKLTNLRQINEAVACLAIGILLLAVVLIFSSVKDWHVYSILGDTWGLGEHFRYKYRLDFLRAVGSTGGPIVAGYVAMIGVGLFLYLRPYIMTHELKSFFLAVLVGGLIVPFARGPWVGLVVFVVTYFALARHGLFKLTQLGGVLILLLLVVMWFPQGAAVVDLLPYLGSTDQGTVDYRELLWVISLDVIDQNPWLGTVGFQQLPQMEVLKEGGGGQVDVVNTYLQISLEYGLLGLLLFVGFWISIVFGILRALPVVRSSSYQVLGRSLVALSLATMVTIFTVSSGAVVALMYWLLAGLSVAYMAMMERMRSPATMAFQRARAATMQRAGEIPRTGGSD